MFRHYPKSWLFSAITLLLVAIGWEIGEREYGIAAFIFASCVIGSFLLQSNAFLADETRSLRIDVDRLLEKEGQPPLDTPRVVKPVVIDPFHPSRSGYFGKQAD